MGVSTGDDRVVRGKTWHSKVANHQRALNEGKIDVCFIGDSLTEFWLHTGKPIWDLEFHQLKCVNLGLAAEKAEDILARLSVTDFAKANPDVFVIMAGTNNLGKEPPDKLEAVALRVMSIVNLVHRKCPRAKILLLSILPSSHLPNSPLRKRIIATNHLLDQKIKRATSIPCEFLDIHDLFVQSNQRWRARLTLDGTHLSLNGYDRLARAIAPTLKERLAKK